MKDSYLVELLSNKNGFNWIDKVYKVGNQYVHFTRQHIWATVKPSTNSIRSIEGLIAKGDSFIPLKEKIWATRAMYQINKGIIEHIQLWVNQKSIYELKDTENG